MRRKTSVVCIGVGSCLLPNVSAEARARLQRCGRLTSPMIRLLRGVCQHPSPFMSRGGLSQATLAGSFDSEARAISLVGMAASNRRRVLQIRRYDSRRSSPCVLAERQYSRPPERTAPWSHGRRESRSPARTAAGIALTLVQYVRSAFIPFGPAVASPSPASGDGRDWPWPERASPTSKERR